jgi:potassium channel LctB
VVDSLNLGFIKDHYSSLLHQQQFVDKVTRSFYFSITTLFSVGYGDMTPFGLSKGIAIFESLIGYVLPYVMVLNYILYNPKFFRKHLNK